MGLSRTEIELLISAKNNAQAAFDTLKKQVDGVTNSTRQTNEEQAKFGGKVKDSGLAAGAASVAVGLLAERMARSLVGAFQDTITEANRLDAGLIGLGATAKAFGTDAGAAQKAAQSLAADGLMNVGEAATGLKNLLGAGFNLPQAIELMNRFKDSAAFGRQGSLEFGQAIIGATEGIKNGNSALVDNVGLTKNLSIILSEAGKQATDVGKVQSDLSVRTALYNGILKETTPQLGQAALYLGTAAGKQAQFNSQITIAQQNIGKVLQPALVSLTGSLVPLVHLVADNAEVFVRLGGIVATVVVPMAALKAATSLGLTPALTGLTAATSQLTGLMVSGGAIRSMGDFRAGIQLAGESAGLTTKSLGYLGTAATVAGAAFAGWQLGRLIADLFGLDKAIAETITHYKELKGLRDAAAAGDKANVDRQLNALIAERNDLLKHGRDEEAGWLNEKIKALKTDTTLLQIQDTINRAIKDGAAENIKYAQAQEYNSRQTAISVAAHDKSAAAQRARIDAELALGKITTENANAQRAGIAADEQAASVRAKRAKITDVLAGAEKAYQKDIEATTYTEAELVKLLKTNEQGFDAFAKSVGLSEATVKRLKDTLTESNKVHTKAAEAAKKMADAEAEIASAGDGWKGTLAGINPVLAETVKGLLAAEVSASAVGLKFGLTDTQVKALTKSLEVEKSAHDKVVAAEKKHADAMAELASAGDGWKGTLDGMDASMVTAIKGYLEAGVSQAALAEAYHLTDTQITAVTRSLADEKKILDITNRSQQETADLMEQFYGLVSARSGSSADEQIAAINRWRAKEIGQLKASDDNYQQHYDAIVKVATEKTLQVTNATRIELSRQARDAKRNYQDLLAIFGPYAANTVEAHRKMIDAMRAEAGKLPTFWQSNVLPAISQAVQGIEQSTASAFASMLTGAQSFGEGMKGVWNGIKKSITDILSDILNQFIHSFLKGMLGAMLGQQGAFRAAFSGLLGGGGGLGWQSLLGIGGQAGAAGVTAQIGSTAAGIDALAGGGAAAGGAGAGAAAGGGLAAGLAGGFAAGGVGIGMGLLGRKLFGPGGKAAAFGAATGFATGAAIGSVVPGIGTLAGGGIGALAGLISGWVHGNSTKGDRNTFAQQQFGLKDQDDLFKLLDEKLAPDVAKAFRETAINKIGKTDSKANAAWMADVVTALEAAAAKERDLAKAAGEAAVAQAKVRDEAVKRLDTINGKLADLDKEVADLDASEAVEENMGLVERAARDRIASEKKVLEEQKKDAQVAADEAEIAAKKTAEAYEDAARRAQNAFNHIQFPTPPGSGGPGGGGSGGGGEPPDDPGGREPEGHAAGGVMASRPGLVVFGEGGETEVGGPAAFFKRVFSELGIGQGGGPAGRDVILQVDGVTFGRLFLPYVAQAAHEFGLVPSS